MRPKPHNQMPTSLRKSQLVPQRLLLLLTIHNSVAAKVKPVDHRWVIIKQALGEDSCVSEGALMAC